MIDIDKDKAKDLSSKLTDDFKHIDVDGGSAHKLSIENGGLVSETWWDDQEILAFLADAKLSRQQETLMATSGAFQVHFCELPASVLTWIINKYGLAEYLHTPEAKRKIFEAVEYDTIIPIGDASKQLPLKLFKHTNKKLGKDKPSNF